MQLLCIYMVFAMRLWYNYRDYTCSVELEYMVYSALHFVLFHITWSSEAEHSAMEFNNVFHSVVGGSEPQV